MAAELESHRYSVARTETKCVASTPQTGTTADGRDSVTIEIEVRRLRSTTDISIRGTTQVIFHWASDRRFTPSLSSATTEMKEREAALLRLFPSRWPAPAPNSPALQPTSR